MRQVFRVQGLGFGVYALGKRQALYKLYSVKVRSLAIFDRSFAFA